MWIAPKRLGHVIGRPRDPRALNAHRLENEQAQRLVNLQSDRLFNQLTDKDITDVRIRPAVPRAKNEAFGIHPGEQLCEGPDRIDCGDGRTVRLAPVGVQSGSVLQQLPDRVRTVLVEIVQRQLTSVREFKHGCCKNRFRNAPPRKQRIRLAVGRIASASDCMGEVSSFHAIEPNRRTTPPRSLLDQRSHVSLVSGSNRVGSAMSTLRPLMPHERRQSGHR